MNQQDQEALIKNISMWSKRIFFFILTNIVITFTLFTIMSVAMAYFDIQIEGFITYIIFYTIIGMSGALISLWTSKWQAIRFMKVAIIPKNSSSDIHLKLTGKIRDLSVKAGLTTPPEIGIYDSPTINAFATGSSKNNSLVAVSTGLLNEMNDSELEGVLAHEIAHIANGDMITMCLIQGVVNVMVYLIAHILAQMVTNAVFKGRRNWFVSYMIRSLFASILYIPGSMLVCWFSRLREYKADHGGAQFAGRQNMIYALQSLAKINQPPLKNKEYSYLMISNAHKPSLLSKLLSTHPPIQSRIKRLQTRSVI